MIPVIHMVGVMSPLDEGTVRLLMLFVPAEKQTRIR